MSTLSSQPRSGSSVAIDHGSPETISEEAVADDEPSDLEVKVRDEQRIRSIQSFHLEFIDSITPVIYICNIGCTSVVREILHEILLVR